MKVVIAPIPTKAVCRRWRLPKRWNVRSVGVSPAEVRKIPIADGGEGTVAALADGYQRPVAADGSDGSVGEQNYRALGRSGRWTDGSDRDGGGIGAAAGTEREA